MTVSAKSYIRIYFPVSDRNTTQSSDSHIKYCILIDKAMWYTRKDKEHVHVTYS